MKKYLLLFLLLCRLCFAATLYVDNEVGGSGSDVNNGAVGTPFRSIQKGIDSMGAGDTLKIVSGTDYTFGYISGTTNIAGSYTTAGHFFTATVDPSWPGGNAYTGKVAYFTPTGSGDVYGYVINVQVSNIISFVAAEVSGREFNAGALTLLGIGDQLDAEVDMDNAAGDHDTNVWLTVTSADTTDPAVIDTSDMSASGGAWNWQADMCKITYLDFVGGLIGGTSNVYCIDTTSNLDGLWVEQCNFNYYNGAVHATGAAATPSNRVTIIDNTFVANSSTGHTAGITTGGSGVYVARNKLTFQGTGVNGARIGIFVVGSFPADQSGVVFEDNFITGMTYASDSSAARFGGIWAPGNIAKITGNVITNIVHSGASSKAGTGGIIVSSGYVGEMYNNIITDSTVGINIQTGGDAVIEYEDYNCVYNCDSTVAGDLAALGSNSITTNPLFVNLSADNLKLRPASPCLNTGKPTLGGGRSTIGPWQPYAIPTINKSRARYNNQNIYD